jgi:hypothetical protein
MADYPMFFAPHRNPVSCLPPSRDRPALVFRPQRRLVFVKYEGQMLVKSNATRSYSTLYDFFKISLRSFKTIRTASAPDPRADATRDPGVDSAARMPDWRVRCRTGSVLHGRRRADISEMSLPGTPGGRFRYHGSKRPPRDAKDSTRDACATWLCGAGDAGPRDWEPASAS